MPHSFLKSLTAWLQLAALPPTPSRNSRPPRARSATRWEARFSIADTAIALATAPTSSKYCFECMNGNTRETEDSGIRSNVTLDRNRRKTRLLYYHTIGGLYRRGRSPAAPVG